MIVLCYLSVLMATVMGRIAQDEETAIINGDRANILDYPFYAYLRYTEYDQLLCGGTIVRRNIILTAAHCINSETNPAFTVYVGLNEEGDLESADRYEVKRAIKHPAYSDSPPHDVAVVILKKKIKLNDKVQLAKLAVRNPREGDSAELIGFGKPKCDIFTNPNGACWDDASTYLRSAVVNIKEVESSLGEIVSQGDNQTACYGDSGGPMIYNGKVVGVASTVDTNDCSTGGNTYTSIPYNMRWIKKHLKLK